MNRKITDGSLSNNIFLLEMDSKKKCKICEKQFVKSSDLKRHIIVKHQLTNLKFSCYICKRHYLRQSDYLKHINDNHQSSHHFKLYKEVFDTLQIFRKHFIECFSIYSITNEIDDIVIFLKSKLSLYPKFKININIQAEYILKENDNEISELFNLKSKNFIISRENSNKFLQRIIKNHLFEIIEKEKELNLPGSGWKCNSFKFLDVALYKINLLL